MLHVMRTSSVARPTLSIVAFVARSFPNADARNAHATKCQANPANQFKCKFCSTCFVTTFNMFGFCSYDGKHTRDGHEHLCDKNPKNICFCGRVFSSAAARDRHAASCEMNPVNRFDCAHCSRTFVTHYGLMGLVSFDGRAHRDAHGLGCEKNSANVCFCGQRFLTPALRDFHAVQCNMNPVNRFACQYCAAVFVTKFGLFTKLGSIARDAHAITCNKNPANATCEFCEATFSDPDGLLTWFRHDAHKLCKDHVCTCIANPRNKCERCGCCFVGDLTLLEKLKGQSAKEVHMRRCDVVPCDYEVRETDSDWLLVMASSCGEHEVLEVACKSADECKNDRSAADVREKTVVPDADAHDEIVVDDHDDDDGDDDDEVPALTCTFADVDAIDKSIDDVQNASVMTDTSANTDIVDKVGDDDSSVSSEAFEDTESVLDFEIMDSEDAAITRDVTTPEEIDVSSCAPLLQCPQVVLAQGPDDVLAQS